MVMILDFTVKADSLIFIVGQITRTTGFTAMTMEVAHIQSAPMIFSPASTTAPTTRAMPPTMLTTHHSFLYYKGRQIDNTDLLEAIDQVATSSPNPSFGKFGP